MAKVFGGGRCNDDDIDQDDDNGEGGTTVLDKIIEMGDCHKTVLDKIIEIEDCHTTVLDKIIAEVIDGSSGHAEASSSDCNSSHAEASSSVHLAEPEPLPEPLPELSKQIDIGGATLTTVTHAPSKKGEKPEVYMLAKCKWQPSPKRGLVNSKIGK